MSPVTHFLTGRVLANTASLGRRDRALVTLAGVIPDVDGLGAIPDFLTRHSAHPLDWFATYHHLLEDLLGARGPDGYSWPVPYLMPFSRAWELIWHGQWALNAWPNFVVTAALLIETLYLAWLRGFSPPEMVSSRADTAFVETLRRWFPRRTITV